jgi:hypothetical protein
VNPEKAPVEIIPALLDGTDAPPANTLRGRVVDNQGRPIAGATVQPRLIFNKDGTGGTSCSPGGVPLAVTDQLGNFFITTPSPFASMDLQVEAQGFARKILTGLAGGTLRHDLTMTEGVAVTGRVLWNGQPLAGVSVGIVSTDRRRSGAGHYETGTGVDGRFAFVNIPPNLEFSLYGIMQTLKTFGAIIPSRFRTGGEGSQVEAGDLLVVPARRLAGRVVLDDGRPIPAKTHLVIGVPDAWDALQFELGEDGGFDATGIPAGVVSVSVRVPGYRVSRKNKSQDLLNPNRLLGRVDEDITNLVILVEKGAMLAPNYNSPHGIGPPTQPLRGAEPGRNIEEVHAQNWRISGRVTDAKTGQPVPSFLVTPGNHIFHGIGFDQRNEAQGSNGVYAVELSKRFSQPVLKVEADGYLPVALAPPQEDRINFEIALQPGGGPAGVVLLPDGKPAADVTVGLFCAGNPGACIRQGKLEMFRGLATNLLRTTGADGFFSFRPELEMRVIVAAGAAGFKICALPTSFESFS